MQTKNETIRVQTLDGQWETIGVERLRGIYPENGVYKADEWGSSSCSFDLRRDPGTTFPDLTAWTPVDVEIGGVLVWAGRIIETPDQEAGQVINVQGKGWPFHLDDDLYQRTYVHATLSDWRDTRSFLGAPLTKYVASPTVVADRGVITLAFPQGAPLPGADNRCGVTLDLGQTDTAKRIVVEWESSNNSATIELYARTSSSQDSSAGTISDAFHFALNAGASGTTAGTFSSPQRYVHLLMYLGAPATPAADHWIKLRAVRLFTDTAYESGTNSVLTASMIVNDALGRNILLSTDRTGVQATSFAFPEFALDGQRTQREVIAAANAVEAWRTMIDVRRRMIFAPKPTAPIVEIGAWPGSEFDGAGSSGEEIYNRILVEGTGADGTALTVERVAAQQPWAGLDLLSTPAPANPSFTTNTATWTPSAGTTITRDTVFFDTSPASGLWDRSGFPLAPGDALTETFTGTFKANRTYVLTLRIDPDSPSQVVALTLGTSTDSQTATIKFVAVGFRTYSVSWTPAVDAAAGVTLTLRVLSEIGAFNIDSLQLYSGAPTLVDRRGFKRTHTLPVRSTLTAALGEKIGDVWLAAHRTTPLKGTVKVTGDRAAREILTGASVPPERLLLRTGELLRLSHRTDPDYAGGQGRDGRIAEVTYTTATDTAVVAIDNRRTSHEALLERLAVVTGAGQR